MAATAALKAASFARDGLVKPLILRTYCNDAAWISSSVAGGSKLNSGLMFLHILRRTFEYRQEISDQILEHGMFPYAMKMANEFGAPYAAKFTHSF